MYECIHPSLIHCLYLSVFLYMTMLIIFDWHDNRQDMSCLQVWWHHYRHQANLQKTYSLHSPSLLLSFSQTYWSRIQITDSNRRWAWLKSGEGTWKMRRRRWEKRNGERERETDRNSHIWTIATPTIFPQSNEMECVCSNIHTRWLWYKSQTYRCKINSVQGYMKMFYILYACVIDRDLLCAAGL